MRVGRSSDLRSLILLMGVLSSPASPLTCLRLTRACGLRWMNGITLTSGPPMRCIAPGGLPASPCGFVIGAPALYGFSTP